MAHLSLSLGSAEIHRSGPVFQQDLQLTQQLPPYTAVGVTQTTENDVDLNKDRPGSEELSVVIKKVQETCAVLSRLNQPLISRSIQTNNCPYRADSLLEMRDHISALIVCAEEATNEIDHCPGVNNQKRLWVYIDGAPDIKLRGLDIRQRLLWQTPLDLEMASVVTRLLRELEEETILRRPNCQGRHYVDPTWGIMVANGTICPEASFEHFMYPAPPYDIKTCSVVLTMVCVGSNWSCYAFDFSSNVISIMDPMVRHPVEESKVIEHTAICKKLLAEVMHCMRRATGNFYMGHGKWTPKMMMARGRKPNGVNSGIIALNCMRWYNGNSVCDPPRNGQAAQTRKALAFQLLTMRANKAKPAISELVDRACRASSRAKKKHETDCSQAESSAAENEDCANNSPDQNATPKQE